MRIFKPISEFGGELDGPWRERLYKEEPSVPYVYPNPSVTYIDLYNLPDGWKKIDYSIPGESDYFNHDYDRQFPVQYSGCIKNDVWVTDGKSVDSFYAYKITPYEMLQYGMNTTHWMFKWESEDIPELPNEADTILPQDSAQEDKL